MLLRRATPRAAATARASAARPLRPAAARRLPGATRVLAFKPTYFPATEQQQAGGDGSSASSAPASTTTTVLLPLDYYACLRLPRASGSRAVREALDCALNRPPPVGYSADTLSVRAVLLRSAADCLLDLRSRKGYDAMGSSVAGYTVEVSTQYLPGALVLLQESGHNTRVIELGAQWLADNGHDGLATDVAAAMALAHHELATQALQQDSGFVSEACQHLETALLLLRRARRASHSDASMAAQLQQEVLQLLEEFSPQCCLELLALPLADPQRRRGHLLLRKLVLGVAPELSPLGQDKDAFLQYARACMTPQEYLDLHKGVPQATRSTEQQLDVALASVAVAFQQQQPLMMLAAARAYDALERAIASSSSSGVSSPDVSVCRASVALLLGNTPAAMQLLGLGEGSRRQPRQDVQEFVLEHSPDASDLLPGVFALAQCWLNEAVMGSFRGDAQAPAELAAWFDARHVRLCIMVLTAATRLREWVFMAAGSLQQLRALPAAVAASMVWLQQQLLQAARAGAVASSSRSAASLRVLGDTAATAAPSTGELSEAEAQQPGARAGRRPRSRAQRQRPTSPVLQRLEADRLFEQHDQELEQELEQQPAVVGAEAGAPAAVKQAPKVQRPAAAAAGLDAQEHSNPFLVASARLAADRSSSRLGDGVDDAEEEEEEEEEEADGQQAVRARLTAQMQSLEARMWDSPPEDAQPAWWARKSVVVIALGCALVAAVVAGRAGGAPSAKAAPSRRA